MVETNLEMILMILIMLVILHKYPNNWVLQLTFIMGYPAYILRNIGEVNELMGILLLLITVLLNFQFLLENYTRKDE